MKEIPEHFNPYLSLIPKLEVTASENYGYYEGCHLNRGENICVLTCWFSDLTPAVKTIEEFLGDAVPDFKIELKEERHHSSERHNLKLVFTLHYRIVETLKAWVEEDN